MDFIHLYALSYIVHINDKILLSFDQFHLINCLAVSKSWRHAVVLNKNCVKNKKLQKTNQENSEMILMTTTQKKRLMTCTKNNAAPPSAHTMIELMALAVVHSIY